MQLLKVFSEISEMPSGIVIFDKPSQPENTYEPNSFKLAGKVSLDKRLHSEKADSPMLSTPSGILILVKLEQALKT
ncbi:MAG: hypothetical protein Q4E59_01215 [Bacteroidales bacterium]|nr:hypothetical protein [Bacteroidales bacterium]